MGRDCRAKAMTLLIGVKVGQKHEPSAVCVAENSRRLVGTREEYHFRVHFLERISAGSPFPAVADRVGEIVERCDQRSREPKRLFLDATGLGNPILALIRARVESASVLPVYFNHGDRRKADWKEVKLGKAFLVARLQMLLQTGRLHLPPTQEAEALTAELLDYNIKIQPDANDHYGVFSVGTRDELVTALGLAVQDDGAPKGGVMRMW